MNIKKLRKQKGWAQQDLADKLELSRKTVSKYENEPPPKWYVLAVESVTK